MTIEFREILQESMRLAKDGEFQRALTLLDEGLEAARTEKDSGWILALARTAAVMCDHIQDLERVLSYYRITLQYAEEDRYTHLAIGGACIRKGERESAEPHLRRCLELALKAGDEPMVKLVREMLGQQGG